LATTDGNAIHTNEIIRERRRSCGISKIVQLVGTDIVQVSTALEVAQEGIQNDGIVADDELEHRR